VIGQLPLCLVTNRVRYMMLKSCVVGLRSGANPRFTLSALFQSSAAVPCFHSTLRSESTWQNILKSVIATIASTSQFVGSHGIDDVAGRLQGLIDGVTEHSNTKSMQLNQEVSKEQLHPEMPNETGNK
jgi:hypothetical protein